MVIYHGTKWKKSAAKQIQELQQNLAKLYYFTNLDFPEIRGFPFLGYLLGEAVWARYNLTKQNVPRHQSQVGLHNSTIKGFLSLVTHSYLDVPLEVRINGL